MYILRRVLLSGISDDRIKVRFQNANNLKSNKKTFSFKTWWYFISTLQKSTQHNIEIDLKSKIFNLVMLNYRFQYNLASIQYSQFHMALMFWLRNFFKSFLRFNFTHIEIFGIFSFSQRVNILCIFYWNVKWNIYSHFADEFFR